MKKCVVTFHSKVRYSERVNYRNTMDETLRLVVKNGLRMEDIPSEHPYLKGFLSNNKIYYDGYIYIFANLTSKKRRALITMYKYPSPVLADLFNKKQQQIKSSKGFLYDLSIRQMFITVEDEQYKVIFNRKKIIGLYLAKEQDDVFPILHDLNVYNRLVNQITNYKKGIVKKINFDIDYYYFTDEEAIIYKKLLNINYGQTITYKDFLEEIRLNITPQKLGIILKKCPIDYLVPTHRVVRCNGQVGSHKEGKQFKKNLLNIEKNNVSSLFVKIENQYNTNVKTNERFSYSIGEALGLV